MGRSGLQEVLKVVYSSNAVVHILSGKAFARALRGFFLGNTALHALLVSSQETEQSQFTDNVLLNEVNELYDKLETKEIVTEDVLQNDVLKDISGMFVTLKEKLLTNCAKLWFQYIDMTSVFQMFIRAERMGNWQLHLSALARMLPYFAASGHNLYLKSTYIYLQKMWNLEKEHPDVYLAFQQGPHVF